MFRKALILTAVPALFAVTIASLPAPPHSLHNPYVNPFQVGCGDCWACEGGHTFDLEPRGDGPKSGFDHGCYPISCVENACGGFDDLSAATNDTESAERELLRAARLVSQGDASALVRLLSQHPDRVSINRGRAALQISASCSSRSIMAHVPLTPRQLRVAIAGV